MWVMCKVWIHQIRKSFVSVEGASLPAAFQPGHRLPLKYSPASQCQLQTLLAEDVLFET